MVLPLNGYPGGLAFLLSSISATSTYPWGYMASVNSENFNLPSPSLSHLLKNKEISSAVTWGKFSSSPWGVGGSWNAVSRSCCVMWPWQLRSSRRKASNRL